MIKEARLRRKYEEDAIEWGSEYLIPFSQVLSYAKDALSLGLTISGCGFWYDMKIELPKEQKRYAEDYNLEYWVPEEIDSSKTAYKVTINFITDLEEFMRKNKNYLLKPHSIPDFVSLVFEDD